MSIALLFASAGAHKLRGLTHFAEIFASYRVLPTTLARRLAWLIPCLVLAIAIGLLWEPSRRMAMMPAIGVLIVYAFGMAINLARGRRDLDCGCGTARDRRSIAAWMVWRNLFLAAALGIAAFPWSSRPLDLSDLLTVMGGLTVGVILYLALDQLLGDVAPRAAILSRTS